MSGCGNSTVFKGYEKFENISWNKFDKLEFEFNVNKSDHLDFYLALRHHTNYPYDYINFTLTIYTPDGEMRSRNYRFELKDSNQKWKSSGMGELWDAELPIRKNMIINKTGVCKVVIENRMSKMETPGIVEVGLVVEDAGM